jgi:acetyltransferase-like isoleucine patch superfamily enzyme
MNLSERIFIKLLTLYSTFLGAVLLRLYGVSIGKNLTLTGLPIVSKHKNASIWIGNNVMLLSNSITTALGVNHPVILRTLTQNAKIEIGDDVGISGGSICAGKLVKIGARSMLGANVTIADTDFHDFSHKNRRYAGLPEEASFEAVVLKENVFVGINTIILKGVTIGRNTVIGAGSVVTHNIPADSVAAGNPCKVIKALPNPTRDKK